LGWIKRWRSEDYQLNLYVEVVSRTPLSLQLTQRNVFLRDAYGGYVDTTGPVKKSR